MNRITRSQARKLDKTIMVTDTVYRDHEERQFEFVGVDENNKKGM